MKRFVSHFGLLPAGLAWCAAWLALGGLLAPLAPRAASAAPARGAAMKGKELQWSSNFPLANLQAVKADKIILLYFSGSDWDEWGQKLDKEVLNTDLFRQWAEKNVIPVRIDFPREKKLTGSAKAQADKMKVEYNISKVPTFLFIDPSGEVLARVGYDAAKLRDHEAEGQPLEWVKYCQSVVDSRPPKEALTTYRSLKDAVAFSRAHAMPILILSTQNPTERSIAEKEKLLNNQRFVRFVNRNMVFVDLPWPSDYDKSAEAQFVRDFAGKWRFGPSPFQLIHWDPGGLGRLKSQITAISSQQIGPLLKRLDAELPSVDYNGGWLEDYKVARTIASRQKKDLFIVYTSMNGSEWSQKIFAEIFDTPEFKKYAKDNLVLLKVDFPRTSPGAPASAAPASVTPATRPAAPSTQRSVEEVRQDMVTAPDGSQPPALKEQNRMLADMYGIRGYPSIVVLNDLGQKISDAKYMKGGAAAFLPKIEELRRKDRDRRTLISEQEAAK